MINILKEDKMSGKNYSQEKEKIKGLISKLGLIGLGALACSGCIKTTATTEYGEFKCGRGILYITVATNKDATAKANLIGYKEGVISYSGLTLEEAVKAVNACERSLQKLKDI